MKSAEKSLSGSFTVRSLTHEIFNDAVYFKEQAKNLPIGIQNDLRRWAYLRASVISSLIVIESFINVFIKQHFDSLDPATKNWLFPSKQEKLRRLPTWVKLTIGVKLITRRTFNVKRNPYKSYKKFLEIRNALIHFEGSSKKYREKHGKDFTVESAEEAIATVRDIIRTIHKFEGTSPPEWVNQANSQTV